MLEQTIELQQEKEWFNILPSTWEIHIHFANLPETPQVVLSQLLNHFFLSPWFVKWQL